MEGAAQLVLVRHAHIGCSDGDRPLMCGHYDAQLSDRGRMQVDLLRRRLEDERPFAAIYSSPLRRALETAAAAAPELAGGVRLLNSLREIDCGVVDGWPIEKVQQEFPNAWKRNQEQRDEDFRWPGGEPYRRFRKRVLRVLEQIALRHRNQRVLVFTHAGVINQLIGSIEGQTPARWENYRPANASITEIRWNSSGPRLIRFGDSLHLLPASTRLPAG